MIYTSALVLIAGLSFFLLSWLDEHFKTRERRREKKVLEAEFWSWAEER